MESFDVGSFHGPLFLGYLFNTTLLGIIMTQGYLYYTTYKDDNWWIKGAVTALMVANIINTTFITAFLYQVLITFFNDPLQSIQLNWLGVSEPFLTVAIILCSQIFFAWRVYHLTSSWLYVVLILVPAIGSAVGGILTGVNLIRHPNFGNIRGSSTFITMWLLSGVICDTFIVVIRLWYMKNAPVKPSSQELAIDRAIRVLLGSGSLTLLVAAADLIVYMKFKGNGMHLMLNLPLCKFFSSNVMNCLNSRHGYKIRWSSEINPHTLHGTLDVRPGDVIEFASVTIKTTASMRSDDDDDAASDFRVQSRFNDVEAANSSSAARPGDSGDSEDKKPRWSEG